VLEQGATDIPFNDLISKYILALALEEQGPAANE
jgi:hypothetical protein